MVTQPRWLRALALATVTTVIAAITAWIPVAAIADTAPADSSTPSTVSSDSLPTVQVNGVVWTQIIVGNTVYVGGEFTQAQPAGAAAGVGTVSRTDMLAYNLTTGTLITGFAPTFNAQVRGLAASPDGSTVYAVGNFTQVNGLNRYRVVALDATTGAVKTNFAPSLNSAAYSVVATASTVYVGGAFTVVGSNTTRTRTASFAASNGALGAWAPNVPDHTVRAMVLSPDGSKMVLGGSFSSLNGSTSPGQGLGAVDTSTGASMTWNVGKTIYDHGDNASIYSLWSDGTNVYGTGYVYGGVSDGNLEGAFNASWTDGTINWIEDCHGDSYSVASLGDAVYTVSHDHYCGNVPGGFQQTDPNPSAAKKQYALAFSKPVAGTLAHDTYGPPYVDFGGTPAPKLLTWYPDLVAGTYTGQSQAAWNVTAGNGYLLLGGEFPEVNGKRQTGLARFATSTVAPNLDGPRLGGTTWVPTAVSLAAGTVRVSWPSNWDRDNANLTYTVTRNSGATPVYTKVSESEGFWLRPTMGFTDTGLSPGSTASYRVKATDPFGNVAISSTVTTTVSAGSGASTYSNAVIADGATDYWRMGEASGPALYDWAGFNDLTAGSGVELGATGALTGDSNTAATFSGDATGLAATSTTVPGPQTFSVETWFRTTSTAGGKIVGFGNANTGTSTAYDRHVYMDTSGRVNFGVYPGSSAIVQSGTGYNDGQWHYVVASLSSSGQQLFLDGKRVANNPNVTSAQAYNGYWRIGGDTSWSGANFFAGSIDDTAIYPTALSASTVKAHWVDSGHGTAAAAPTDAYGAQVFADAPDSYWRLGDPAGSSTAADASGNGVTATANSGVTFGAAGGVRGTSDTAATFNGSNGLVVSSQAVSDPETYTLQLWFNTTTTSGGKLIGFGDQQTGTSSNYDRHVWMLNTGQLEFGTYTGQLNTITSSSSYNDGAWHQVVASQGADGLKLSVDGALVGTNPQTQAQAYTGYWRLGGDTTWGGNSSNYFAGAMDDVAIYSSVLSPAQISNDFQLGTTATTNAPPTAAFTSAPNNLAVAFDGTSSSDSDGTIASYAWDFGDSTIGSGSTTSHTYATPGTYTVALTVTDDKGATNTISKTVTVTAANMPPTASFTAGPNGLGVAFDGSGSSDSDGAVKSYAWDFGDSSTGTGATPSHTYTAGGTYQVTLTVKDDQGATGTVTKSVTVVAPNQNPTASFTSSSTALQASFDASASADPDGTIASYAWDFGDGASGTGRTPSHTYAGAGSYSVRLTVTDNSGGTGTAVQTVTVAAANISPTASFTSASNGLAATFDGSASTDPDGTIASYAWDFGDGTTGTGLSPSHTYAAAGSFTVVLTVTDNGGATGTKSRSVAVATSNAAPTASFTSSGTGLTIAFDGSGSSDSDGTIASSAWDFGDGSTGTGATPSHTYATGGMYSVKLTVTDNGGLTGTVTKTVTATAPSSSILAKDAFGRNVANGLGTADTGGAWTTSGTASDFSVGSGVGTFSTTAGQTRSAYLSNVTTTSADVTSTVALGPLPTGGTAYVGVVARRVGSDDYNARITVTSAGVVGLQLLHGGTSLKSVTVSGVTYTPGTQLKLRFQVFGTSPTTLQARVWSATGTEPTTWQATATDSTSALQAAGSTGLRDYLGSGVTSGRTAFTYDDFSVQNVGGAGTTPNAAPTAAFASSASNLAVAFDGTGSADSDGTVARWAWDFGDGASGSGSTTTHTYAAAGTYTVVLAATDNEGATGTVAKQVTVTAPASTHLASDAFGRTVTAGLGTADVGGAWTTSGGASNFSVGSGAATLSTVNGATLSGYLSSVSAAGSDVSVTVTVPKLPVGGSLYAGVVGRRIGTDDYSSYVIVSATGAVNLAVQHTGKSLKSVAVPGITAVAGSVLHLRMTTVTSGGTTTLQARTWLDTTSQPSTWQSTATDATAAMQAAGSVGIRTYVSGGVTNAPIAIKLDDFVADPAA